MYKINWHENSKCCGILVSNEKLQSKIKELVSTNCRIHYIRKLENVS